MKHALVIVNPSAGNKSSDEVNESLAKHFRGALKYEVYETKKGDKPGDIVRKRLRDGFDLVVAAGGDGTVSAVVDGLVGQTVPLGIIPVGTGNLLARELDLPIDIDKAVAFIASGPRSKTIDAMKVGERTCVLSASVGFSPRVIGDTSGKGKKRFGKLAYWWAALRNVFKIKHRYLDIEVDGVQKHVRAVEVVVANCGRFYQKLSPLGPDIRLDDGHLDVWILGSQTIWDYPLYLFGRITGRSPHRRLSFLTVKKSVTVKSSTPLKVQVDGELSGKTPLKVDVIPGALTVLVAEDSGKDVDEDDLRDLYASQFPGFFRRAKRRKAEQP